MAVDQTEICPVSEAVLASPALASRLAVRTMSADEWVDRHASGTLRKNKRLGFAWNDQYLHERIAFEFGWPFFCTQRSRITWGVPITEGDCHSITEAGWHMDRLLTMHPYPEDYFEVKYINFTETFGHVREGIGIVVRKTSTPWIPKGYLVVALVTEYDPKTKSWSPAIPC